MNLFRVGRSNLLPFAVCFDKESRTSTIIDRLYRPLVCCAGKWPRCDLSLATVAKGPALYGAEMLHQFFGEHAQPAADPVVRRRLRALVGGCSVLRDELRRRSDAVDADPDEPPPTQAAAHADLIRHTFSEGVAA
jgi:hypothetical protein